MAHNIETSELIRMNKPTNEGGLGMNVSEICAKLGIDKQVIYQRFKRVGYRAIYRNPNDALIKPHINKPINEIIKLTGLKYHAVRQRVLVMRAKQ